MSVSAHLTELKKKHESLGLQVEEAQRSPGIDDLHIAQLKKQKLKLKEEIEQVKRTRNVHRQGRKRNRVPVVAVVGYTNAGRMHCCVITFAQPFREIHTCEPTNKV